MASQRPVLIPRGAQVISAARMALLAKCDNKSDVVGREECDSGFQDDSFKTEGGSFERDSCELRCIVKATKNITIDDESMYKRETTETEKLQRVAPSAEPSSNPTHTQQEPLSPENCLLNFAQCNDVRYLLAPMRNYLFVQDEDGDTPLHLAIIHMKLDVVEAIVGLAPSLHCLNIFNFLRQTPLHLATITKQPVIVRGLIMFGASIDLVDRNGKTALHLACERGDFDCVMEIIRPLSDQNFSEETRDRCFNMLNSRDFEGFTALQRAVFANSSSVISALTEVGAEINVPDGTSGKTALHHAVEAGNLSMVSYLLFQCQAEVDAFTFDECTPLHFAAGRGLEAMTGLLIAAGADPLKTNRSGASPQDEAADNVYAMLQVPQVSPW